MSAMKNLATEIELAQTGAASADLSACGPPTGEPVDLPAPVDSSHVELAHVELDWTVVFEADVAGRVS
jgi:hypothetical protein